MGCDRRHPARHYSSLTKWVDIHETTSLSALTTKTRTSTGYQYLTKLTGIIARIGRDGSDTTCSRRHATTLKAVSGEVSTYQITLSPIPRSNGFESVIDA